MSKKNNLLTDEQLASDLRRIELVEARWESTGRIIGKMTFVAFGVIGFLPWAIAQLATLW